MNLLRHVVANMMHVTVCIPTNISLSKQHSQNRTLAVTVYYLSLAPLLVFSSTSAAFTSS